MKIQDLFNLKNNVAIVTGGTGYLGYSMSEALAEAGADVYLTGRDIKKCEKMANQLQKNVNGKIKGMLLNITSTSSIKRCFNQIVKKSKKIDILVNNAVDVPEGKLESISEKQWKDGIDGTINAVFRCTQAIIPFMKKRKTGSIINISSMYGEVSPDPSIYENTPFNNPPNYSVGKAAINQFSRYSAIYLAKYGIRVNTISPGAFPKPSIQKNRKFLSNLERKTPLGRIGQPHELKGVVVFLSSRASSYVTGENIHVDGGWTAW